MTAREFEDAVFDLEGVRIVLRCPVNTPLPDYLYDRRAAGNTTVNEWLAARISHRIGGHDVAVIDGLGGYANRRMKMSTLRDSYAS